MTDSTLDTFQTWLRQTITVAVDGGCSPGDVAVVLREEASHCSDSGYRDGDGTFLYEIPNEDLRVDTQGVLAQVIAGSLRGRSVRFFDLVLDHPGYER